MILFNRTLILSLGLALGSAAMATTAVDDLLASYRQQGASNFSAAAGKRFWNQATRPAGANTDRSCASCHTNDVRQNGRHAVTGKTIKPMAPSIIGRRLTNPTKIGKWFKRNCNWTRGRDCTPQEKGDVLTYLKDM